MSFRPYTIVRFLSECQKVLVQGQLLWTNSEIGQFWAGLCSLSFFLPVMLFSYARRNSLLCFSKQLPIMLKTEKALIYAFLIFLKFNLDSHVECTNTFHIQILFTCQLTSYCSRVVVLHVTLSEPYQNPKYQFKVQETVSICRAVEGLMQPRTQAFSPSVCRLQY